MWGREKQNPWGLWAKISLGSSLGNEFDNLPPTEQLLSPLPDTDKSDIATMAVALRAQGSPGLVAPVELTRCSSCIDVKELSGDTHVPFPVLPVSEPRRTEKKGFA